MLLVIGVVAVVVYERVGLRILRRRWFNMDLAWSLVLIASGAITPSPLFKYRPAQPPIAKSTSTVTCTSSSPTGIWVGTGSAAAP